jgi:hypothetical protein
MTNSALAADCDLRGLGTRLRVAENATINLCGRRLYVPAQVLTGTCTFKGTNMDDHTLDLTANDSSRVTATPTGTVTPASNAFNNNYARGDNAKRILVAGANLPFSVTYDFGESKVVDACRLWVGPLTEYQRMPKRWRFEGSNDNDDWQTLDTRRCEVGETVSGTPLPVDVLGEKGGEVVVRGDGSGNAGATCGVVEFGGRFGYTGYRCVLDGGTIDNAGDDTVADLRLDADSYMKTTSAVGGALLYGATIDLSDMATTLNTVSSSSAGNKTLRFKTDATIGVKLGERKPAKDGRI